MPGKNFEITVLKIKLPEIFEFFRICQCSLFTSFDDKGICDLSQLNYLGKKKEPAEADSEGESQEYK
jgi:hypothetical protein